MNSHTRAHLAVLSANLFFGHSFGAVRMLTAGYIAPFGLNLLRIGVSVPLFWLLYVMKPSGPAGIRRADLPRFLLCALSGVAVNQLLFIKGLSYTTAVHASLLALGTPVFITAAAGWLLHERLTLAKLTGLGLGISGALILLLGKAPAGQGSNMLLGDIMILINSISYALYFVWVRPLMDRYHPIQVVRWVFTLGALMILPFGWHDFWQTDFSRFTPLAWASVAVVVLGATFLAYLFNMYGIRQLGPGITGTYIYTQPLFASIIGVLFMNEHFGIRQMLAALLIAAAVLLVTRKPAAAQRQG